MRSALESSKTKAMVITNGFQSTQSDYRHRPLHRIRRTETLQTTGTYNDLASVEFSEITECFKTGHDVP